MKKLTHEQLLASIHYNPLTGLFTKPGAEPFAGNSDGRGYMIIPVSGYCYRAHRLAWQYMTGEWPSSELDHINGIKHDNRFSNLRICTHQQNNHNQGIRKTNTSGIKGVYWNKSWGKWMGQVCLNYKIHHTSGFDEIDSAASAVRELRESLHGEFANHG